MIKFLRIQSLILIELMEISFVNGLNVLSGETGSGKSAILEGIKLLFGSRHDPSLIRHGCSKASIEAILDLEERADVKQLLGEAGIDLEEEDSITIKRELSSQGKSRAFICHQPVQLALLKKLGQIVCNLVDQHANHSLFSIDTHRKILDLFCDCHQEVQAFSSSWQKELSLIDAIRDWEANESRRLREIEVCKLELTEFNEANIKEGEEEELFEEYTSLSSSEERLEKAREVYQSFSSLIPIKKQKTNLESLAKLDKGLSDLVQSFNQGICELEEVAHQLRSYTTHLEPDPTRLEWINKRLALITKIRKKYGPTYSELEHYFTEREKELTRLENSDAHIDQLKSHLEAIHARNRAQLEKISSKRQQAALLLQRKVTELLQELNMVEAEFTVKVEKQEPTSLGQDRVEFFIKPNKGENALPIRDGASGGELARILLALRTVLAGKEERSLLVFDEIDANIGGTTAALIGEKLKQLGLVHQIICVTHFPQVAKFADHHLNIRKMVSDHRTISIVTPLNLETQQLELLRMQGCLN
ncbi:MAG: DNA repair protein RecN [Parachlamydiaceae bacterium]